jgi:nucleoside-diphosphate-sugar epimerase
MRFSPKGRHDHALFVAGATGNIGSKVVTDLIAAGHQMIGLCRLEEQDAVRSDGVIHPAFDHNSSRFI